MSEAVFIRVHDAAPEQKGGALRRRIASRGTSGTVEEVFPVDTEEFAAVPGSPFAYWVSDAIRQYFREFPRLEGGIGQIQRGLFTGDDFRFLRLWWEPRPTAIGFSPKNLQGEARWIHLSKGGAYSPFYADIHLVANWRGSAAEIEATVLKKYPYLKGDADWVLHRESSYGRRGITWPLRTTSSLSIRRLPEGCLFSNKSPVAFVDEDSDEHLSTMQAILQSSLVGELIGTMLAAATAAARSYEQGLVQSIPVPTSWSDSSIARLCDDGYALKRVTDTADENSHVFTAPLLLWSDKLDISLVHLSNELASREQSRQQRLIAVQTEIDHLVFDLSRILHGCVEGGMKNTA